jgi:hypothetical protein
MNSAQLLIGGLIAAVVLITPLVLLVVMMCRPTRRARLAAAPWTPVLILLLLSLGAWLWVVFGNVQIHVQLHGLREATLALMAAIAIYAVWLAAPVAGLTWALLKVRSAANRHRMIH